MVRLDTITHSKLHTFPQREYIPVDKSDLLCLGHIARAEEVVVGVMRSSDSASEQEVL
jgi:hypothetical protein